MSDRYNTLDNTAVDEINAMKRRIEALERTSNFNSNFSETPLAFVDNTTPTSTTTSATFVTVQLARTVKRKSTVTIYMNLDFSDGTTTGEMQVLETINSFTVVNPGQISVDSQIVVVGTLPGSIGDNLQLEIQLRRTSGAGTFGVRVYGAWQS